MGSKCFERLQDRIPAKACAVQKNPSAYLHREGGGMHAGRNPEHVGQKGYLTDSRRSRGLLLSDVPGAEKDGRQRPVIHLKGSTSQ